MTQANARTKQATHVTDKTSQKSVSLLYGRDIQAGTRLQLGTHTLTEQAIIDFATAWDPQYFHVDKAAAAGGVYGGLIASGIHTLAIYQRLVAQAALCHWQVIAGRSLRDLRFLRPVRPGDTLTANMTIDAVTFDDRNRALVTNSGVLTNQHGKHVLSLMLDSYVWASPE